MDKKQILDHWHNYVQSPAELAFSRARRFPFHMRQPLASTLGIRPSDRVLEVGSGTGILYSHLSHTLDSIEQIVAVEPNETYRNADVPESLKNDPGVEVKEARGEDLPFADDEFDHVTCHTLFNVLDSDMREAVLREMKRVTRPGGVITAMDAVAGAHWYPPDNQPEEAQRKLKTEFYDLHQQIHEDLETGLYNTFNQLPGWLAEHGLDVQTRGWFQPFRLSDDHWTEQQVNDLINLEYQANRDRIENLRRLLQETNRWKEEYGDLFRELAMDSQRVSHRRRKLFDHAKESGWTAGATLIAHAQTKNE